MLPPSLPPTAPAKQCSPNNQSASGCHAAGSARQGMLSHLAHARMRSSEGMPELARACRSRRRGFERLIRKMLDLPSRPAVAYFHAWAPRRTGFAFYESPEDLIDMVPAYYGLPSVSMRNALHRVLADGTVDEGWLWRSDPTHANCLGHRCIRHHASHTEGAEGASHFSACQFYTCCNTVNELSAMATRSTRHDLESDSMVCTIGAPARTP